jgi:hypothetical protein
MTAAPTPTRGDSWIARTLAGLLLAGLVACSVHRDAYLDPPMPDLPPAPESTAPLDPAAPRWEALLVAGTLTLRTADDAAIDLADRLDAAGVPIERLHELSADPARYGDAGLGHPGGSRPGDEGGERSRSARPAGTVFPARPALVLRQILQLRPGKSGACLTYLAGTGTRDGLKLLDGTLTPADLDRALGAACGAVPTVVIVSGCGTGAFAAPPMARANRLVIAAGSSEETGFGCGPNDGLTTFDECLLGTLDGAARWSEIFEATGTCVRRRETLAGQPATAPRVAMGALAAGLAAPWQGETGSDGIVRQVRFERGIGRFDPDGLPYFKALKALTRPTIDAYLHAGPPKALALTLAGTVAWAASGAGETPEDVARLALQRCEWRSGGACILYARNAGLAAAGAAGLPEIHPPMLIRTGPVEAATVPFIRDDQRPLIAAYLARPSPKALALGPDTEAIGTGATAEEALARCAAAGGACVVFAEGDRIVLGRS